MQALHDKHEAQGFTVVAISIDRGEIETVTQYVEKMGLTFPNLHDSSTLSGAEYAVRGVPTTYFISPQGDVLGGVIGPRQWDAEEADQLVQHFLSHDKD